MAKRVYKITEAVDQEGRAPYAFHSYVIAKSEKDSRRVSNTGTTGFYDSELLSKKEGKKIIKDIKKRISKTKEEIFILDYLYRTTDSSDAKIYLEKQINLQKKNLKKFKKERFF